MKRPIIVTFLGCLFIVAGLVGLVYHLSTGALEHGIALISLVRILAIVGGVFLLLGKPWARWLVVLWLAFHVIVSAFHSASESTAHAILLVAVTYCLFSGAAAKYFRPST